MGRIDTNYDKNCASETIDRKIGYKKFFYKDATWKIVYSALLYLLEKPVKTADIIRDIDSQSQLWYPISMGKLQKLLEVYGLSCYESKNLGALYIKDKSCTFILRYRSNDGIQYCFGRKSEGTSIISFTFTSWQGRNHMAFSEFWECFVRGKSCRMLILNPAGQKLVK